MAGTPDVRSISAEHREVRRGGRYGVFGEENGKRGPWKGARMPAWLRVR
jgi:hypothetical protein